MIPRVLTRQLQAFCIGEPSKTRPALVGRDTTELKNLADLVDFVVPLQQWSFQQKLSEDTAQTPHVYRSVVDGSPKEELRGTVPQSDHKLSEIRWRR